MKALKWVQIFLGTVCSLFKIHRSLALENLALRQQRAVFKRQHPRPTLHSSEPFGF